MPTTTQLLQPKILLLIACFAFHINTFGQNTVQIEIKTNSAKKKISPYIFGKNNNLSDNPDNPLSEADWQKLRDAGVKFFRENGGNNSTKYNWRRKLSSHPDWYNNVFNHNWGFQAKSLQNNIPYAQGMWGFQLIGKAAKSSAYNFNSWEYNQSKGWAGVHQNLAGGGEVNPNGNGNALKQGNPALYLEDWPADSTVQILDHWFNNLSIDSTKVRFWSMDNEPEIWQGTHDDVYPEQPSAEDFMQMYFEVAKKARAKFPGIKLCGPVPANEWLWYNWKGSNIDYKGQKYVWLQYFIKRIAEEQEASGIRLLDVLDIHFYPGETEAEKILQLHRVYFDKAYNYPGANGVKRIGGWDNSITKEYILERCAEWLDEYLGPNHKVKFGISETGIKSDNPNVVNLWYASTMGEFIKNEVDFFTPWGWRTGMWETLHLFSNYSNKYFVEGVSSDEEFVSSYPTINKSNDSITLFLVNRHTSANKNVEINFQEYKLNQGDFEVLQLFDLPNHETFVSHTGNALKSSTLAPINNKLKIRLAPLSVSAILITGRNLIKDNVRISSLFSDNMVLQQNSNVPVWGWANPGDTVLLSGSWDAAKSYAVTDSTGKWLGHVQTPQANTNENAYTLQISGNNTIVINNVLIGEVWLLSGQSNMAMTMSGMTNSPIEDGPHAIANANLPNIRLLTVNRKTAAEPQNEITNTETQLWQVCTPNTVKSFSAVGFFFGRELNESLHVPIGLVCSSWGGSSCETWANKSSLEFVEEFAGNKNWQPNDNSDNHTPTVLYNGMIAPLIPYKFAGVCWYQGETNAGRPEQLTHLFPAMIEGWRQDFEFENMPFYYVQLAPYGGYWTGSLPIFWEAQAYALNLHHTGMASTLDAGDQENIHPARKKPVGFRLAQKALFHDYGMDSIAFSGPRFDSISFEGNKIRIHYLHAESGLKTNDEKLNYFEIAGSNNTFYPADAVIDGKTVLVSSSQVLTPTNVRYAWSKSASASLYNKNDFPATPFRSNPPSYISTKNLNLIVDEELIHEGSTVHLSWTSAGLDNLKLNNKTVSTSGNITQKPDSTTTYSLSSDLKKIEKTVYVIPKELNSWAKGKIVSASSAQTNNSAKLAVDDNLETEWVSTATNEQNITIDLGEKIPINLIILHWGSSYAKAFEIQFSDDNSNWTTVYSEQNGNGNIDFIPELKDSARYVRMQGIARLGASGYSLLEFKVYSSEYRKTGTLLDKNKQILRGTPMVLGKQLNGSVQFASDISNWEFIRDNGFNTIRVCWVDPWYNHRGYEHWSISEVLPYFDKCVENATNSGMNIVINYHNVGAQLRYDTTYTFALEKQFWDSIAPRYKDNDRVYYEIANEPTFKITEYMHPVFKKNLLEIYNNIRTKAPDRQILMFSFNQISQDILRVIENYKDDIEWDKTTVAYHMYGSTTSDPIKTLMAYHRVICTEWNYDHVSQREGFEYIKQVDGFKQNSETLEKLGSGWIDWRDWSDTTLNELIDTLIFDAIEKNYWWGEPKAEVAVTGIRISHKNVEIKSGESKQLTAFVVPALAENQQIIWTSDNENIAKVSPTGLVTGISTLNKTVNIKATSEDGNHQTSCEVLVLAPEVKEAYPDGIAHAVPGTINPTHYDLGGEGIAYHDINTANLGDGIRPNQGVDTGTEHENGSIMAIQTGEWLEYTIDVQIAGKYNINIYFASPSRFGKFHLEINQENITGDVYVSASGSNNVFRATTIKEIELKKGIQVLRVYFDFANYKMGSIQFERIIPVLAENKKTFEKINVYPNPSNGILNVDFSIQKTQNIGIDILNINGKIIKTVNNKTYQSGTHHITNDLRNLKSGMYLVAFRTNKKTIYHKIILN